jgi:crossover junction endodeoxyribonuclease RusA
VARKLARHGAEAAARWDGAALVVTLPLPPKELSPNARAHWRKKSAAVKAYRALAANAVRLVGRVPRWEGATMTAVVYMPDARTPDDDNAAAALKAARDGIADAGLVENDRDIHAGRTAVQVDRDRPRVEITLTELNAQQEG